MNFALDFGNSTTKAGIFSGKQLVHVETHQKLSSLIIDSILRRFKVENAIVSSVTQASIKQEKYLAKKVALTKLTYHTDIPLKNFYETPATLGTDRIANMVGARILFPNKNVLVISAGSCITCDVVTAKGDYFGGNISPGLDMRFLSMHNFTAQLPLVKKKLTRKLFGRNTRDSMLTGVMNGILFEMKEFISEYRKKYSQLNIVLTGGDSIFFENQLQVKSSSQENKIFAVPHLVLHGLNEILRFNGL